MTANDEPVRATVLATPGVVELLEATTAAVVALLSGPSGDGVIVADGCAGGRHRAPVFACHLTNRLRARGIDAVLRHRDLDKPVVMR